MIINGEHVGSLAEYLQRIDWRYEGGQFYDAAGKPVALVAISETTPVTDEAWQHLMQKGEKERWIHGSRFSASAGDSPLSLW